MVFQESSRFAGENLFSELLRDNLISLSPDGLLCKITDYGVALYEESEAEQRAWLDSPIISVRDFEKDQVVIQPGQPFRGRFLVLSLFKRARTTLKIQDNYLCSDILDWLYGVPDAVNVKALTSPKAVKQDKPFESMYRAYRVERPRAEVRLSNNFHDRKLILDDGQCYGVGESLKDIGTKGTTLTHLLNVSHHEQEFERLWNASAPL